MNKNEGIFIDKNIWIDFYNFKEAIILVYVDVDYNEEKKSCFDFIDFLKKNKKNSKDPNIGNFRSL